MKTNIQLQIEKLRVLEDLLSTIDVNNYHSTRQMLLELVSKIETLINSDF